MFSSNQPLVSIVIPAYNGMPYLEEAIESVLAQDYPNVELIVLDDGSKDETAEFLKKYQDKFHFETHPNMGQAATLNKGWAMCKGEILGYLSADDMLTPDAVRISVQEFLKDSEIVLTYPDYTLVDTKSRFIRTVEAPDYDYHKMIFGVTCQVGVGAFFLRNAYDKIGGWNPKYRFVSDYEFQIRLASTGSFRRIHKVLGSFRIHPGSASFSSADFSKAEEIKILMEQVLNSTNDLILQQRRNEILSKAVLISGRTHWRAGRYRIGFNYFIQSLRLFPKNFLRIGTYKLVFNALLNRMFHKFIYFVRNVYGKEYFSD
jgi:glycosyltransferase involved in cell wall biosynthesis